MKNKIISTLYYILIILLISNVYGINITINDIDEIDFSTGQTLMINSFIDDVEQDISIGIEELLVFPDKDSIKKSNTIFLSNTTTWNFEYAIERFGTNGFYSYSIALINLSTNLPISGDLEIFHVKGIMQDFEEVNVNFCNNEFCVNNPLNFKIDEIIEIKVDNKYDAIIKGNIILPNRGKQTLEFNNNIDFFTPNLKGNHQVIIEMSKQDFNSRSLEYNFNVYDENQETSILPTCNVNIICEKGENTQNCPQDCYPITTPKKDKRNYTYLIIGLLIILSIYLIKTKKKPKL